jgi:hypothetical protein
MGDARAAGGAGSADGQMHCMAQSSETRLQGPFMGASSVIVAQPWCITVCSALACDRAINDADAMACSPTPITEARLVTRISNFRRATTCMQTAYAQLCLRSRCHTDISNYSCCLEYCDSIFSIITELYQFNYYILSCLDRVSKNGSEK